MADSHYDEVRAVYLALKKQMEESFPPEHYVAIAGGKMVADADSLDELRRKVRTLELNEENVMFDQVGYDMLEFREYPGWGTAEALVDYWIACLMPTGTNKE
jgi:hypothetical protein